MLDTRYSFKDNKGLLLVASLWIVAILALLAIGLAHRISLELHLVKFSRDRLKAQFALDAALQFAREIVSNDANDYDSFNEFWANGIFDSNEESVFKDVRLKEANFTIGYQSQERNDFVYGLRDEESKLNINTAPINLLQILFYQLGIENSREIAASILDWIDQDEMTSFDGAEDDHYQGLPEPYHCKNAPLSVIEELLLIKGMDEEKFEKIKPFVTLYGDGKININTTSAIVIESLLISRGVLDSTARKLAKEVSEYRLGDDGIIGTGDDKIFRRFEDITPSLSSSLSLGEFAKCADMLKFKAEIFRADILATSANKVAKQKAACIFKKDTRAIKAPELVYWQEQ
ncbi:MAG: hypothetical protein AB1629_07260 [Candidatus Omnitrophota bacterium]